MIEKEIRVIMFAWSNETRKISFCENFYERKNIVISHVYYYWRIQMQIVTLKLLQIGH